MTDRIRSIIDFFSGLNGWYLVEYMLGETPGPEGEYFWVKFSAFAINMSRNCYAWLMG